jgi:poly(A) polymerase
MAARPRLFEEVLRLLRSGSAHRAIWLAWETGVLDVLLPELSAYLSDLEGEASLVWRLLTAVDDLSRDREEALDDVVLWTVLLYGPMQEACSGTRDRVVAALDFLDPIVARHNVPRRIADAVRRIVAIMPRLLAGRAGRFGRTVLDSNALDVRELLCAAQGSPVPAETKSRSTQRRR